MRTLIAFLFCASLQAQMLLPIVSHAPVSTGPVTPPAYVSACAGDNGGGAGLTAVTTNCSLAAGGTAATDVLTTGNSVYVIVFAQTGCSTWTFTITDVALNTYPITGVKVDQVGAMCVAQFSLTNAPNGSAINAYTVTTSTAVSDLSISTFQMSGSSAPLLQTSSSGTGGGTTVNTAPVSPPITVAAGTIVVAGVAVYALGRTYTADSGYTIPAGSTDSTSGLAHLAIEYRGFSTAPANQSPGPTASGAGTFMITLASTFK